MKEAALWLTFGLIVVAIGTWNLAAGVIASFVMYGVAKSLTQ